MSEIYHRDFFEPKEVSLSNITKKFGKVVLVELSFKDIKCGYNFEIHSPYRPVDIDSKVIEWEDLEKKLRIEEISKIEIHKETRLFSINFWQDSDVLGIIHCKDIKGLPEHNG